MCIRGRFEKNEGGLFNTKGTSTYKSNTLQNSLLLSRYFQDMNNIRCTLHMGESIFFLNLLIPNARVANIQAGLFNSKNTQCLYYLLSFIIIYHCFLCFRVLAFEGTNHWVVRRTQGHTTAQVQELQSTEDLSLALIEIKPSIIDSVRNCNLQRTFDWLLQKLNPPLVIL